MPMLAAFPKAWMQGLCVDGSLPLERWIEMAAELDIDGLEFYSGFLELREPSAWGFSSASFLAGAGFSGGSPAPGAWGMNSISSPPFSFSSVIG